MLTEDNDIYINIDGLEGKDAGNDCPDDKVGQNGTLIDLPINMSNFSIIWYLSNVEDEEAQIINDSSVNIQFRYISEGAMWYGMIRYGDTFLMSTLSFDATLITKMYSICDPQFVLNKIKMTEFAFVITIDSATRKYFAFNGITLPKIFHNSIYDAAAEQFKTTDFSEKYEIWQSLFDNYSLDEIWSMMDKA